MKASLVIGEMREAAIILAAKVNLLADKLVAQLCSPILWWLGFCHQLKAKLPSPIYSRLAGKQ